MAQGLSAQSLSQSIQLALSADKAVASASARLHAADLRAKAAGLAYLPLLKAGGSYQYLSDPSSISLSLPSGSKSIDLSQTNAYDLTAGIQWTVFDGLAREANVHIKQEQQRSAANNLETQRRQTALQTITAYRSAQAAQLQVQILASAAQQTELLLKQTQSLFQQGMAKEVDVLSLQLSLLDDQQKSLAAQALLADAQETLQTLTQTMISVDAAPQGLVPLNLPPFDPHGLTSIRGLVIQETVLKMTQQIAASTLLPRLDTSFTLHQGLPGVNPSQNQWMTYATAGLQLTWSYDWGSAGLEAAAVSKTLDAARLDEASARDQALQRYNSAVRDWKSAQAQLAVLKTSLDLAATKLRISKTQFAQGQTTSVSLNEAVLSQSQATLNYRSQVLSLLLKASQIDALSGQNLDQWRTAE